MNNSVFGKTVENVRNQGDIRLVTNKKRIKLVQESNCHTTKWFSECLIVVEMNKMKVIIQNPISQGLSKLDLSKTLCMNFGMDADSFIINIEED